MSGNGTEKRATVKGVTKEVVNDSEPKDVRLRAIGGLSDEENTSPLERYLCTG